MFVRSKRNPIIKPSRHAWESRKTYNPAALYDNGVYHVFYRANGREWNSYIGYAVSVDGERFTRFPKPLIKPEHRYEEHGCEDPRIAKIGDTYFLSYAALGRVAPEKQILPRVAIAVSKDLKHWKKYGPVLKKWNFYKAHGFVPWLKERPHKKNLSGEWSKATGIFPEKIGGKYWMLFGDMHIWLASSIDGKRWTALRKPLIKARGRGYFDESFVENGPAPIRIDEGWLVLYHGIDDKKTYSIGYAILDAHDPQKIIYRSKKPVFEPTARYELSGLVDILPGGLETIAKLSTAKLKKLIKDAEQKGIMPKVTFCNGATLVGDNLRIYYGAADSVVCTAKANLRDILRIR
ncbi:MAG TPA: hypothetical protein VMC43_02125 [Candidatus Paceibacterota bacterium]|nr:hypothetical protein [Candidatus Paceibacterota bacterium]